MEQTSSIAELADVLDAQAVRSVFQPIVQLSTGGTIGYEALARGPEGSPLAAPIDLFDAAGRAGRTQELEWQCRTAALRGALERLPADTTLFVNVEPSVLATADPPELVELTATVAERMPVVLELTERALVDAPATVLEAVARFRALGCSIALDDVGADPRSIALLPYVRPDVIKLDLRLVQDRPTLALASTVHAVSAAAERSGAELLAEGVETPAQRDVAEALGATYAQGWHFGRPTHAPDGRRRLPVSKHAPLWSGAPAALAHDDGQTPFELVTRRLQPRIATKRLLFSIATYLEHHVAAPNEASVLLSTFEEEHYFTDGTRARYARLAEQSAFVTVYARGMPPEPAPGVRGAEIATDDPLAHEWDITVVTPHLAATLAARDLGDEGCDDWDRRFAYCLTYDRDLAVAASELLMRRATAVRRSPAR